jgi:hypothetical protein
MKGRWIIVPALLLYAIVVGCAMLSHTSAPAATHAQSRGSGGAAATARPAIKGLPYRSVGMQIQRLDWIDKYKQSIDEIAALGADTVKIVVDTRQENGSSTRIYLDVRMTPTADQLTEIIQHAKRRNLRVILMPVVLLDKPRGTEWRGSIKPTLWEEWFESYREMIQHFAWIAEDTKVDVLVIGSELVTSESKTEEWRKTIELVRASFSGQITYSANWDHYTAVTFWDQLDLIGMNSYWKLGKDRHVTVEQIEERWKEIQSDLLAFVKKTGKPLLLLEVGWCSMANMAHEPWDYTTGDPIDLDLQRKLYEGFFRSWHGNPYLGGFSMWEWTPGDGGPNDRGYTPENKPAEAVLREWLAKGPWPVH